VKIALAQINPTVGDFTGNLEKIIAASRRAAAGGARLTVFSELAICGYPPADFLEKPSFLARCRTAVDELAAATADLSTAVLAGVALPSEPDRGKPAVNAAVLMDRGARVLEQQKRLLPFYDVFDEQRYFAPARSQQVVELDGVRLAISICEDAWNDKNFWQRPLYAVDPIEELMRQNPALHINLSSSPFWHGKRATRRAMLSAIARRDQIPVLMCNQVGGNDSLIFDGSSLAIDARGELISQAASFAEDLVIFDPFATPRLSQTPPDDDTEAAYQALVLGTRDYVRKCGFKKVLIALSGGIDSALVAAIAKDAMGAENVLAIGMPSPYSSQGSVEDSRQLAASLGIHFELIAISDLFKEYTEALGPLFNGFVPDTTEENIQSRIRGTLMMALSNKFASLVLTTGNKSEMAVGYCTLYGDMCGALAPIADVLKTEIYELSRWINRNGEIIPWNTIEKPPSAELRPNQTDQDSLPPYDVLDRILRHYVVDDADPRMLIDEGIAPETVKDVLNKITFSEYKRRQAAPGLKVSPRAFGMGRRVPIAQGYRG
jgi:NAD+ synthase (glutamine-hydrolysing)